MPYAYHTDAATQADAEGAAHAIFHRNQAGMTVLPRQIDRRFEHRPGSAYDQKELPLAAALEVLLERAGDVTVITARAIFGGEHCGVNRHLELFQPYQVRFRAAAEEQTLAGSSLG